MDPPAATADERLRHDDDDDDNELDPPDGSVSDLSQDHPMPAMPATTATTTTTASASVAENASTLIEVDSETEHMEDVRAINKIMGKSQDDYNDDYDYDDYDSYAPPSPPPKKGIMKQSRDPYHATYGGEDEDEDDDDDDDDDDSSSSSTSSSNEQTREEDSSSSSSSSEESSEQEDDHETTTDDDDDDDEFSVEEPETEFEQEEKQKMQKSKRSKGKSSSSSSKKPTSFRSADSSYDDKTLASLFNQFPTQEEEEEEEKRAPSKERDYDNENENENENDNTQDAESRDNQEERQRRGKKKGRKKKTSARSEEEPFMSPPTKGKKKAANADPGDPFAAQAFSPEPNIGNAANGHNNHNNNAYASPSIFISPHADDKTVSPLPFGSPGQASPEFGASASASARKRSSSANHHTGMIGRSEQLQAIAECVHQLQFAEQHPQVVYVRGDTGTGKSMLARELVARQTFAARNLSYQNDDGDGDDADRMVDEAMNGVYCCYGSFSDAKRPFSGITDCFHDLIDRHLLATDDAMLHDAPFDADGAVHREDAEAKRRFWRGRLEEALGGEGPLLSTVVPNILNVLSLSEDDIDRRPFLCAFDPSIRKRLDRLAYGLRDFVTTVSAEKPVVMVLDDLHLADEDSLVLIRELLTAKRMTNVLVVAAHEPVGQDSPLAIVQEQLHEYGTQAVAVDVANCKFYETKQYLLHMLRRGGDSTVEEEHIRVLAKILHERSHGGNPLLLRRLLQDFQDRNWMTFDADSRQWTWDCDVIRERMQGERLYSKKKKKSVRDFATALAAAKVEGVSKKMRLALTTAACVGLSYFDVESLFQVIAAAYLGSGNRTKKEDHCPIHGPEELAQILQSACAIGVVRKMHNGRFQFAHEQVREGAASLLPPKRKGMLIHFRIGTELSAMCVRSREPEVRATYKFLAVEQLNQTASGIADKDQLLKLATLNMEAAEICIVKTAFATAATYLEAGIALLDDDWRRPRYDLCLRMHVLLARMKYALGDVDATNELADVVLRRAACFKDKVGAFQVMTYSLMQTEQHREAMDLVLSVLFQLGQDVPRTNRSKHVQSEMDALRKVLRSKKNSELLNAPRMTDKKAVDAMAVLAQMAEVSRFCGDAWYQELAITRMVRLTANHGFCRQSPLAYALFSVCLAGFGLHDEAYRYGRVAERLVRHDCPFALQASAQFHWHVSHWRRPFRRNLEPILKAYNAQIDIGDFEHVSFTITTYISHHIASGCELDQLEDNMGLFEEVFLDYDLPDRWQVEIPYQMIQALSGQNCGGPLVLLGEDSDEQDDIVAEWEEQDQLLALEMYHFLRLTIAIFFHNTKVANDMLEKLPRESEGVWVPYRVFFEGLLHIARVKELSNDRKRKQKYLEKVDACVDQLSAWASDGAVNCDPMVGLLSTEASILSHKKGLPALRVRKLYDEAIGLAAKSGLTHIEALCHERAAIYFVEAHQDGWSSGYFARAHRLYERWGAKSKAVAIASDFAGHLAAGRQESSMRSPERSSNISIGVAGGRTHKRHPAAAAAVLSPPPKAHSSPRKKASSSTSDAVSTSTGRSSKKSLLKAPKLWGGSSNGKKKKSSTSTPSAATSRRIAGLFGGSKYDTVDELEEEEEEDQVENTATALPARGIQPMRSSRALEKKKQGK